MPKVKLSIWNQRMLLLMEHQLSDGKNKIDTIQDFCDVVGIAKGNNIHPIKHGKTSFTHEQIYNACKAFGTSPDWIYGFSNGMYRKMTKTSPIQLLKAAVRAVELVI